MSMNSPHDSAKDVLKDLWKDKPLLIAVVVAILIVLYLVYKYSQASILAPAAASTAAATPTGNTIYNSYSTTTKTVTGSPSPTQPAQPAPPKRSGSRAIIRAKQTSGIDAGWDSTHAGVPIRSQPSGYNDSIVRLAAFGSSVPLIGPVLNGGLNQQGGSMQWYPVVGGYLSAWDIASIQ